jgi:hypothetical protein
VTNELNERFLHKVGRHFVAMSCVQVLDGGKEKELVFSGFLIDADGVWFYVTAGHILRDIRKVVRAGGKFDAWRLTDLSAGNKFKHIAIPFHFDDTKWAVVENEELGLDYAAMPLDALTCLQLEAGDAMPISKIAWGDHVTSHDQWGLVGIPSETVDYDGKTIITGKVVVIPVEEEKTPPKEAGKKAQNQFYGRLKEDSAAIVKDIDGMSGGPLVAIKKVDGIWKYSVIGIQSGWYADSRIIAACPFSSFALELEQVVQRARSLLEASKTEGN